MKTAIALGATGFLFGFFLSRIGFSSWDEVHAMFLFADFRLTLAFGVAVGTLAAAWFLIRRVSNPSWSNRSVHPGTVIGGVLFGVGWSLSGSCPSIALVQLGEGQLGAIATLAGVFVGNWAYAIVHEKYFRWTTSSCLDQ